MLRSIFILAALPLLVIAGVARDASNCGGGTTQCCKDMHKAGSKAADAILEKYNLKSAPGAEYGHLAVGCSGSLVGVIPGGTCEGTPVCCQSSGVVALGCIPIHV